MNRRQLVVGASSATLVSLFPSAGQTQVDLGKLALRAAASHRGRLIPPLYTIAYIEPDRPSERGQEEIVAKYPMALVPQDDRPRYRQWRDDIKKINPEIVFLAYQMTIEEASQSGRGPGHNLMDRVVKESWIKWPWGTPVRVGRTPRRIFDPRSAEWKAAFLDACDLTLASYPYDGLFLDQCSVFGAHHPLESVRREMRAHLQEVITELRKRHPEAILVGNSTYNWSGLNGEMSENRESHFASELAPFPGHYSPNINLALVQLDGELGHDVDVRTKLLSALSLGAFFSASVSSRRVSWFPVYDELLQAFKPLHQSTR